MLNILIFGPPGCGKGTQSEFLVNQYNLKHLSTGDIFRENIKNKTDLGIDAKKYIDWILSDDAKKIINNYKVNNQQLFYYNYN